MDRATKKLLAQAEKCKTELVRTIYNGVKHCAEMWANDEFVKAYGGRRGAEKELDELLDYTGHKFQTLARCLASYPSFADWTNLGVPALVELCAARKLPGVLKPSARLTKVVSDLKAGHAETLRLSPQMNRMNRGAKLASAS